MKKIKIEKGITLVALIITIVVLLILAVVAINAIVSSDIVGSAQGATEKHNLGSDHEKIKLAMDEYTLEKYQNPNLSIVDSIKAKDWCNEAIYDDTNKTLKITTSEGKKYTVKEDGTILNGIFDYTVYSLDELKSAVLSAADGAIIGIFGDITVNTSIGNGTSKNITLSAGDENASLNMDSGSSNGLILTLEGLKIITNQNDYVGFTSNKNIKYINCTIEGKYFSLTKNIEFEKCTFNQTIVDYNIWTHNSNVTFTNCIFNCSGKGVLIYGENASSNNVITLNNCQLNATSLAEGKASIEVDSTLNTFTVNINNCTSTGFDKGTVSGNDLWNNKRGTKATIIVDGVTVVTPE